MFKLKDCLEEAYEHQGNVSVLVFASHKRYGGGYKNHSKGQEEYLFNRTNLSSFSDKVAKYYPFNSTDINGFTVTDNGIDFIFMPALVWDSCGLNIKERVNVLKLRVKEIYSLVKPNNTLILGGWGCGVFKCPPDLIAVLFKEHKPIDMNVVYCFLDKELKEVFEQVNK